MGAKYEVLYWDYKNGKYVTVEHTNSFIGLCGLSANLKRNILVSQSYLGEIR